MEMNLHNELWNMFIESEDQEFVDLDSVITTFRLLMDPVFLNFI